MKGQEKIESIVRKCIVPPGTKIALKKDYNPGDKADFTDGDEAAGLFAESIQRLADYQEKLYAQDVYSLLIILQALDAAGKDSVIKHVMSGLNPQATHVVSFKAPSAEELDHDYLWRCSKALPERGRIGIFNRSYYEEVLVVRVHPEILAGERLPPVAAGTDIWDQRFQQINNFENYLVENGTVILKFFLNVSKEEQKRRFLERIERPEKHWKFSAEDLKKRTYWNDYQKVYEEMLNHTSTAWAPWYVIPADPKWFTRLAVATIAGKTLAGIGLDYPALSKERRQELKQAREMLEREGK
jgi:PPK2 family polyphosphate:nucleotide phosphotransferase